jgi:biopolymer transport protein ExbB/TolQ
MPLDPLGTPPAPLDLSLAGLLLQADWVVKGVAALLLLASILAWSIILDRGLRIARARRQAQALAAEARAGGVRLAVAGIGGPIVAAGLAEWQDEGGPPGLRPESRAERRARIERPMRAAMAVELRRLEAGLPFLATVGSAAPFVGLFGTVWGIMNSFAGIAGNQDTSLAVVAPGIAEALFATALGLAAAIPAVVGYNRLAVGLRRVAHLLGAAVEEIAGGLARRAPARPAAAE